MTWYGQLKDAITELGAGFVYTWLSCGFISTCRFNLNRNLLSQIYHSHRVLFLILGLSFHLWLSAYFWFFQSFADLFGSGMFPCDFILTFIWHAKMNENRETLSCWTNNWRKREILKECWELRAKRAFDLKVNVWDASFSCDLLGFFISNSKESVPRISENSLKSCNKDKN